ncbi:hypothetical protein IGI04_016333 [Brassica rapa subsp. trilocularis]|uniref:Uncharacterized protein n=1 Tax=Brassica rapa subsp. trilocularis TaxID=1813537 RepID=A0ABQ7MV53_BRACM|nr:hypothetical protein IGI04_016333 [Brassica rapa subsp. trilocularis]
MSYHVDARYVEMEKDKLRRVNQEACGEVETMWTQDAELTKDKHPLGVFLGRAEAVDEVLTTKKQIWID